MVKNIFSYVLNLRHYVISSILANASIVLAALAVNFNISVASKLIGFSKTTDEPCGTLKFLAILKAVLDWLVSVTEISTVPSLVSWIFETT